MMLGQRVEILLIPVQVERGAPPKAGRTVYSMVGALPGNLGLGFFAPGEAFCAFGALGFRNWSISGIPVGLSEKTQK